MPRRKLDWVYRGEEYLDDGTRMTFPLPSYTTREITVTTGLAGAQSPVLYDSHNRRFALTGFDTAAGQTHQLVQAARAEGRKALIRKVEGVCHMRPSVWAVGSAFWMMWAIMTAEQDLETGFPLLPTEFQLLNPSTTSPLWDVATHRNNKRIWATGEVSELFTSNDALFTFRPRWSGKRALGPEEALYLYCEAHAAAGFSNPICRFHMRTLVADEG